MSSFNFCRQLIFRYVSILIVSELFWELTFFLVGLYVDYFRVGDYSYIDLKICNIITSGISWDFCSTPIIARSISKLLSPVKEWGAFFFRDICILNSDVTIRPPLPLDNWVIPPVRRRLNMIINSRGFNESHSNS